MVYFVRQESNKLERFLSESPASYDDESLPIVPPLVARERPDEVILTQCYYCGEPATSVDHVIPQAMLKTLRSLGDAYVTGILVRFGRRLTVPACKECNSVLGASYQDTLAKRKRELKTRLRRRYRKLLRMPDWTDTELAHVDGWLQDYVIRSVVARDRILARLAF